MPELQISGGIIKSKKKEKKKKGQSFLFCATLNDEADGVMHWEIQPQCRLMDA